MEPSDFKNIEKFAGSIGAIFAVEDTASGRLKAASDVLEGVEANGNTPAANGADEAVYLSAACVDLELVSIRVKGKKRPVDALKFSKKSEDGNNLCCVFFELQNLRFGFKSLLDIMPVKAGETEIPAKYLSLSFRERQIAVLVGRGMSSVQIAEHLCIAENTVKNHRKRMRRRLGFQNKTDYNAFLQWAAVNGLAG